MPYTDLGIEFFLIGEPGAPHDSKFNEVQDYRLITKNYNSENLFVDKEFPADMTSIGPLRLSGPVEWKRPSEISKDLFRGATPIFIDDIGEPRFDIYQGHVGDCWYLCSLADITLEKDCFNIVVPKDNTTGFDSGAFHFRFWRRGTWLDVVVDDRLPCYTFNGVIMSTVFLKVLNNQYWCALVEKAYAKLYGTYRRIDFGLPMEAMEDFSGGVTDYLNIVKGINFKQILRKAYNRKSFIAVGTAADTTTPEERRRLTVEQLDNEGIVSSHAYSVHAIVDVTEKASPGRKITLIHLRNPWGNDVEWKGKWSDRDGVSWNSVTEDLRLGHKNSEGVLVPHYDGEFWMSYDDWLRKFAALHICHWSATDHGERSIKRSEIKPYSTFVANSSWTKGAKGDVRYKGDLLNMPSYTVHLENLKHVEDPVFEEAPGTCTILVNLMYKNYTQSGVDPTIPVFGFRLLWAAGIYEENRKLDSEYFAKAKDVFVNAPNSPYGNTFTMEQHIREITFRYELPPGTCCVVPFVDYPRSLNAPATIPYLLRIFAEGTVTCTHCKQGDETVYVPPGPTPEPVKPVPEKEPVKPVPEKEPVKPVPEKEPVKPVPEKEPVKPVPETEPVKPVPEKEPVKPVPETEPVKPVPETEPVKPVPEKEPVKPVPETEPVKPVPEAEPVKPVPETEPVKPVPEEEPVKPIPEKEPVKPLPDPENPKEAVAPGPDPYAKAKVQFKAWAGDDGLLDASELKKVLDGICAHEIGFNGFGDQTCRSVLATVDPNDVRKINFEQCRSLTSKVVQWINIFKIADKDKNGFLKNEEVNSALRSVGFNLNSITLTKLRRKYADYFGNYSLDKFIQLLTDLNNSVGTFNNAAYNNGGFALFDLNSWINSIFSL